MCIVQHSRGICDIWNLLCRDFLSNQLWFRVVLTLIPVKTQGFKVVFHFLHPCFWIYTINVILLCYKSATSQVLQLLAKYNYFFSTVQSHLSLVSAALRSFADTHTHTHWNPSEIFNCLYGCTVLSNNIIGCSSLL